MTQLTSPKRILVALAALAMIGTACSGPDPATAADAPAQTGTPDTSMQLKITAVTTTLPPIAGAPDGFKYHDVSSAGFRVAVPERWAALDLTGDDISSLLSEMALDADIEAMVLEGLGAGFSFMAIDVLDQTNINVLAVPRGPGDTLDNIESVATTTIEQALDGTILSTDHVDVDGVDALRVVYKADFGTGPVEGHQYYILTNSDAFIATFTTFSDDVDRDTFAKVMSTFELSS